MSHNHKYVDLKKHLEAAKVRFVALLSSIKNNNIKVDDKQINKLLDLAAEVNAAKTLLQLSDKVQTGGTRVKSSSTVGTHTLSSRQGPANPEANTPGVGHDPRFRTARSQASHKRSQEMASLRRREKVAAAALLELSSQRSP